MNRIIKLTSIWLAVLAVIIFFHFIGWLRPIEGYAMLAIRPVQSWTYGSISGVSGFYNGWIARRDLLAENERLAGELQQRAIDESRLNTLEQENKLLQDKLGFVEQSERRYVAATVIGPVADDFVRAIVINRGSADGITPGMAVVAGPGILIGKVIEVSQGVSKVLLLADDSSKIAATMQNMNHTAGLVEGQFGLNIAMTNIPQDQVITDGDLIVSSGLEGSIPAGLPIARVTSINQIESDIFKTAVLEPLITMDQIGQVLVLLP